MRNEVSVTKEKILRSVSTPTLDALNLRSSFNGSNHTSGAVLATKAATYDNAYQQRRQKVTEGKINFQIQFLPNDVAQISIHKAFKIPELGCISVH